MKGKEEVVVVVRGEVNLNFVGSNACMRGKLNVGGGAYQEMPLDMMSSKTRTSSQIRIYT